jgi:hypothetical protein
MLISASDAPLLTYAQSEKPVPGVQAGSDSCSAGLHGKLIESVPFQIVHGLPVISVRTKNHQTALFMLDSGSEFSILNMKDVARLGFKLAPIAREMQLKGIAAVSEVSSEAKSVEIFVGKSYRIHGQVLTLDLTEFNHRAGVEFSGIIGYDILRTRPMALDYKNGRFLIYKKIATPEENMFLSEKLDPGKSQPVVASSLDVAGMIQGEVRFEIDTGNDTGVMVSPTYSESHELTKIDGWKKHGSMGFNGSMTNLGGLPGSVTFGGQTISISSVDLSAKSAPVQSAYDLSVGSPAFADRCLLFDAPKGMVYLSRLPADTGEVVPREEPPR